MTTTPEPGELSEIVRTVTSGAARRYVGLAVGAVVGSRTATFGTGAVTPRDARPPTGDTLFQIGSVTKVFTALALADAVVSSSLSLDTPLASILPETPRRHSRPITLGDLASHTSGLPRLPKGLRRQALHHPADPYRSFATGDLMSALTGAHPRPEPGRKVRYSNFGAALLGEAVSRHRGLTYEQLVDQRVTGPLGLHDTVITPRPDQQRRQAASHSRRRRLVPDWDLGGMPGAGALRSTVDDLLTFITAHLDPQATPMPQALELVQQPRVTVNRWLQVALGWHLSPVRGTAYTCLWHNGGTAGSCSYVAFVPQARVGVVVLTNTGRPVDRLGSQLLQRLLPAMGGVTSPVRTTR